MLSSRQILLLLILCVFGAFVFLEATAKKNIDWTESFWKTHNKPFGAEAFHEIFTAYHPQVVEKYTPPYENLKQDTIKGTYIFFNNVLPTDDVESKELLSWVEKGNTLFMSAEKLPKSIEDTLQLVSKIYFEKSAIQYESVMSTDTLDYKFYRIDKKNKIRYFTNTDTLSHTVLGYAGIKKTVTQKVEFLPNFVKAKFGKGLIYLHLYPYAFTNYFLVTNDNYVYTKTILKDINYDDDIFVDQYHKAQRDLKARTFLTYLVKNKHLRWAYYTLLFMTLIYIIFEGKRKQKAIRVIRSLENKTFAFTKTIANMYYRKKDHKSIATKYIEHFYDIVRNKYKIQTNALNNNFIEQLSSKSSIQPDVIKLLLNAIKNIENKTKISKEELLDVVRLITKIKN